MRSLLSAGLLPLGLLLPGAALAQAGAPAVTVAEALEPIRVDGVLDEASWARAVPVTDFLRYEPTAGGPPPGGTEVRFLQDADTLYIGMRITGADYDVRGRISEREDVNADDQIGVYLDTFADGQSAYIFYINARGIQQDARYSTTGFSMSWDAVFTTRGRLTDDGYIIEMALPFRSIRYPAEPGPQSWRVSLTRKIPAEGAKYVFPHRERNAPRFMQSAARLDGVRPPRQGAGLELIPGLTVLQGAVRPEPGAPLEWQGVDPVADVVRPSLDVRYGLSPNIGLAATVNPDFSQVEVDETPVSLNQRFAFYFQERRPFFLDGIEHFSDRMDTLYSRSIVDPVYGAKVSGEEQGWGLGVLQAIDRAPQPSVNEAGAPGFDDVDGAWASSSLLRLTRDTGQAGYVGMTLADKRLLRTGTGEHQLLAADTSQALGRRWEASGTVGASRTSDGQETLLGSAAGLDLGRAYGIGTGCFLSLWDVSEGYRQELGFQTQSGYTAGDGGLNHTFEPEGVVNTVAPGLGAWHFQERNGDRRSGAWVELESQVAGVHEVYLGGNRGSLVEEGVSATSSELWAGYEADLSRWLSVEPFVLLGQTLDYSELVPATEQGWSLALTLRPTPGIRVDASSYHQRFQPEGGALETGWRQRGRLGWQFTQALGLRLVGELVHGNALEPTLTSSVLLRHLPHPGTALYLGYVERTDVSGAPEALSRTVFAKGTFLLRL